MTRAMITVAIDDVTIERDPTGKLRVKDDGITAAKIKDGEVKTEEIATGSVDTDELATGAVTNLKIADATIKSGKLAFGTWEKIVDRVVTGAAVTSIDITADDAGNPLSLDGAKAYLIIFR